LKKQRKGYKKREMNLNMEKRSMPVCFTTEQYKKIEEIAKKKGMLNSSQGLEKLLSEL
jgi:hypothetical protein|tara:strand:+ start:127 stop:300 length:174 start_codon:yes stop_codon:yes gene_type:complete